MKKNNSNTSNSNTSSIFDQDEMCLKAFYLSNYSSVRSYVLANSGTEEEAKDVYQEAIVIAWRKVENKSFTENYENALPAYIFKIAKLKWIDELRRKKAQLVKAKLIENEVEETEELIFDERDKLLTIIKQKLKQLDVKCQNLLMQFYYEEKKIKHLAEANNWTEATAKNNKYRCLEKLRKLIKENDQ